LNVVFVAGRDPRDEVSGGHSAYVRSYARAALLAGYLPHLFCAASDSRVEETPFGVVHRIASPVRPFRQVTAGLHAAWVAPAIVRFAREQESASPGRGRRVAGAASGKRRSRLLIHGFGVWGYIGVVAAEELRRLGCDAAVVVSSYTTYEEEARASVAALGAGAYGLRHRLAARLRHLWVRAVVERWERRAYLDARRLLVNYDSVRRLVQAKYGSAPACQRIPYTCEAAFERPPVNVAFERPPVNIAFERQVGDPRPPLILTIARHDARKGVDVLLHALAALRASGVALRACLVGGGPLLADHRDLAVRLGLTDAVALVGPVPDTRPYLVAADLFVLPSRTEQSGSLAALEALQSGTAVVASAVDGLCEDLTDGEDALLVPPADVPALAGALRRCLEDAGLRQRLARRGQETFLSRFSPAAVAAALGEVYASLGCGP
jgi:glycosyltransferase involved in cell wall biosynthesis